MDGFEYILRLNGMNEQCSSCDLAQTYLRLSNGSKQEAVSELVVRQHELNTITNVEISGRRALIGYDRMETGSRMKIHTSWLCQ